MSATTLHIYNHFVKLAYERSLTIDVAFNSAWVVANVFFVRFIVLDTPLLYMMSSASYVLVMKKFREFNSAIKKVDEDIEKLMNSQILSDYKKLQQFMDANQLVKLLSVQNNLLIVPFLSSLIVINLTKTENFPQLIMKFGISGPASVYSVRGVVLTAILARFDPQSKVLGQSISSRIARGKIKYVHSKIKLKQIIEDLASDKNNFLMRIHQQSDANGFIQTPIHSFPIHITTDSVQS